MTRRIYNRPTSQQPTKELVEMMQSQLDWLSYHALALCVQRLLVHLGYEQVSVLSRTFLRGRTNHSGMDLVAKSRTTFGARLVAIQLKRCQTPISRRSIHEFLGAMLCYDAPYGILLTTSTFAPPAREAAKDYPGRPIELVDDEHLARLMIDARIGVRDVVDPKTGFHRLEFVPEEFGAFEQYADAHRRGISCGIWGCE